MSTQDRWVSELRFAEEIARQAGERTIAYFRGRYETEEKGDGSPVTTADREAEAILRDRIRRAYPADGILGEEYGDDPGTSGRRWILDPIDGTRSFVHGIPLYSVLVALIEGDEPVVGIIHNPATDETAAAATGCGCRFNGGEARVRGCGRVSDAWLQVTDFVALYRAAPHAAGALFSQVGAGRTWADAHGYLLVATARADIMIDPVMHPWDVAALKPIIREAGGTISDLTGNERGLGSSCLACGDPRIHREVLSFFASE